MTSSYATPPPEGWEKARIRVDDFLALRESGAFAAYYKSELLEGEMWGVFSAPEDCGQWDNLVPILLRPIDHDLLRQRGAFDGAESKLRYGEIWVKSTPEE